MLFIVSIVMMGLGLACCAAFITDVGSNQIAVANGSSYGSACWRFDRIVFSFGFILLVVGFEVCMSFLAGFQVFLDMQCFSAAIVIIIVILFLSARLTL